MGFLYFAYGSNMLPARLQARCSTARVIGTATAQNFELNFSKLGKDSSGKATLVESAIGGTVTPGVLFEIERIELHHLDQAEGAGYDRDDDFHVTCASTGEIVVATTYLANAIKPELEPFDWYLALVLAGGHHNSLNQDHQRRLRANNYFVDTDHSRESRTEALRGDERIADLANIERLILQLEKVLETPAPRRSRGAIWTRISVTPDLEISVRGDLEPRERILFEQLADQFRAILTGRTKK